MSLEARKRKDRPSIKQTTSDSKAYLKTAKHVQENIGSPSVRHLRSLGFTGSRGLGV